MTKDRLFRAIPLFAFLWGAIGYAAGTATLLGPVRWVTGALRASGAGDSAESAAVIALIVMLVALSGVAAAVATGIVLRSRALHVRFGVPGMALVAALLCVWVWLTPSLTRGEGAELTVSSVASLPAKQVAGPKPVAQAAAESKPVSEPSQEPAPSTHFTFGPYPEREKLEELKAEGYDAVVPLLHPAVVPFEPRLLAREKQAAAEVGIELIHLPMLPWVGDNADSLERLRELAASPGHYYVHCYLGRDRVRLAHAVVSRALEAGSDVTLADGMRDKAPLEDKARFERGPIVRLEEDVFVTPYPTDEEFASRVVSAPWGAVVSLLDPEVEANRQWIEKEREILARYGMELVEMPISVHRHDEARIRATVEAIRALPRPLLVHDFLAAPDGKSSAAQALIDRWQDPS